MSPRMKVLWFAGMGLIVVVSIIVITLAGMNKGKSSAPVTQSDPAPVTSSPSAEVSERNAAPAGTPLTSKPENAPSADTTGPQDGVKLKKSESMTVTKDGTVVENKEITGTLRINANNVTVRNVRVLANTDGYGIAVEKGFHGTLIEHVEVHMGTDGKEGHAGIGGVGDLEGVGGTEHGDNVTVRHTYIHGLGDGLKATDHSLYEGNYIEMSRPDGSDGHIDGIQASGRSHFTIRWNTIEEAYQPGRNAAIFIQAYTGKRDNNISDIKITENWLNGAGYTFHSEDGKKDVKGFFSDITVADNIFGRGYKYGVAHVDGPIEGNIGTWADNNEKVPTGAIS